MFGSIDMEPTPLKLRCATVINGDCIMNNIVYLVGAVVIILAILSFFGLR
jgi:hypothetical protein